MFKPILVALGLASLLSCGDTCNDDGDTFADVRLDEQSPPVSSSNRVDVRFSAGTGKASALPDTYFGQCAGVAEGDAGVAACRLADPGHLEVTLTRTLGAGASFSLEFPDRRSALRCNHWGSNDAYHLDLSVKERDTGGWDLAWTQEVHLGPI